VPGEEWFISIYLSHKLAKVKPTAVMVYHRWGLLLLLLLLLGLCVARARAISAIDVIDVSTVGIDIAVGT